MDNDELFGSLKARGFTLGTAVIREDGTLLLPIDGVYMFRPDAVDVATGRATVEEVRVRNKGKVFPNSPRA